MQYETADLVFSCSSDHVRWCNLLLCLQRAMTSPNANGQRFLAVAGDFMSLKQIAQVSYLSHWSRKRNTV
jgi:hypothetical protein